MVDLVKIEVLLEYIGDNFQLIIFPYKNSNLIEIGIRVHISNSDNHPFDTKDYLKTYLAKAIFQS